MAENGNNQSDIVRIINQQLNGPIGDLQKSIENLTDAVNGFDPTKTSQSSAKLFRNSNRSRSVGRSGSRSYGGILDEFENGIREELQSALKSSSVGKRISKNLNKLADQVGVDVKDIPGKFANSVGSNLLKNIKNSGAGKAVSEMATKVGNGILSKFAPGLEAALASGGGAAAFEAAAASVASALPPLAIALVVLGPTIKQAVGDLKMLSDDVLPLLKLGFGKLFKIVTDIALGPGVVLVREATHIAAHLVDWFKPFQAFETLGKVGDDIKDLFSKFKALGNRFYDEQSKNLKYQQERVTKDIETIVRQPFEILMEAAKTVQSAWDQNLKVIASTQQYSKAGVQSLMTRYADRLSREGLSSYISGADLTSNLTKVLQAGLSGAVAEEFAYIATKLNAAIPTQDFFGYVEDYTVVFNSAIRSGKSQADALKIANKSLEDFASNALYASRVLNNGATTSLSSWENLYKSSVQIAQAAKVSNVSEISSALTAVQGYVGSIAPDLASSITDAVVKLATGGNDSSTVALRSLWGGNASNTEFLKGFVQNPRLALEKIFTKLGEMFTDSSDAYMEKAEGYADLFGLSAEAFQRVDWQALGKAVLDMADGSSEYRKNVKLLTSGQTTLTKEQLANEQINKYLLDQGLSYVLDNEVARAVQQHMWDEQIARELQATTYGVEITGAALTLLEDLKQFAQQIFEWMNPLGKVDRMAEDILFTVEESLLQRQDLKQILTKQKVGAGNAKELYGLMTTGADLDLIGDYYSLIGVQSASSVAKSITEQQLDSLGVGRGGLWNKNVRDSQWGSTSSFDVNRSLVRKLNSFVEDIPIVGSAISSFQDWIESAGFDVHGALSAAGKTEDDLRRIYEDQQFAYTLEQQRERQSQEASFYKNGSSFFEISWNSYVNQQNSQWNGMYSRVDTLTDIIKDYVTSFSDYFINHSVYNKAYSYADVERIRQAEKNGTGDAILALAETLTANSTDLSDPMVQTNTLLAKILLVATTIMQQGGNSNQLTLPDTLTGMAMGGR